MERFVFPTVEEIVSVITDTGLRKSEIARRLDVSANTVNGWCKGKHNISEFNFIKLKKLACPE